MAYAFDTVSPEQRGSLLFGIISAVTVETDARTGVVLRRYGHYSLDLVLVFLLSLLVFALALGAALC
jgi:hypothetical protein